MSVAAPSLNDQQLGEMLGLIKSADSVELKLTVDVDQQRSAIEALKMDPLEARLRLVHFFDTPELALEASGLVVRARRIQGRGDDSVVKLRPVLPDDLSAELRDSRDFFVEVDAMPGGYVCSGSLKGAPTKAGIREILGEGQPLRRLFSKSQRRFFADHAPDGINLDDLSLLGPVFVLKLKAAPPGFDRRLTVELWLFPDGSRILELSSKCATNEAFQVAAEARAFLAERGIETGAQQQTKTRKALELFSQRLR